MITQAVDVGTTELTHKLRRLCRQEKHASRFHLTVIDQVLAIRAGRSTEEIAASGMWPEPVSVPRRWAEALVRTPLPGAITSLSVSEGKLCARDNRVTCTVGPLAEVDEDAAGQREDVELARRALGSFGVRTVDVEKLIACADPKVAELWGPEDKTTEIVVSAWRHLARHGVETSAIKALLNKKSRDLWKSPPRRIKQRSTDEHL